LHFQKVAISLGRQIRILVSDLIGFNMIALEPSAASHQPSAFGLQAKPLWR
jgi:hypothetical protein